MEDTTSDICKASHDFHDAVFDIQQTSVAHMLLETYVEFILKTHRMRMSLFGC